MLMNTGSITRYESWEPARQGSPPQFTSRCRRMRLRISPRLSVGYREACADGEGGELIDCVSAGAPVRELFFIEAFGHPRMSALAETSFTSAIRVSRATSTTIGSDADRDTPRGAEAAQAWPAHQPHWSPRRSDAANGRHATETTHEAAEWGKHGRAPDAPRPTPGRAADLSTATICQWLICRSSGAESGNRLGVTGERSGFT
jgi:hypothetical protein